MTKIVTLTVVALMAAGITTNQAYAGEVAANAYLNVNISLNGVKQSELGIAKVRISNLEVIQAIANETTNSFTSKAKLLLKIPVGLEAGPSFVVRDIVNRTNVVDFEVPSTILWMIQIGDSVDSTKDSPTGISITSQTTIWEFTFQSSQASFDVHGYTTCVLDNKGNLGQILADSCPVSVMSKAAGTGLDAEGNSIVLQGTISANGRKIVNAN
jgi:hypothetical protein